MLPSVLLALAGAAAAASSKRGLCFVPDEKHPQDNSIWASSSTDLTWYYNYGTLPSPALAGSSLDFVPMMWGANTSDPDDSSFLDAVVGLIDDEGVNVTTVLGFNEPDAPYDWGGSDLDPRAAARAWVTNMEPLAKRGVRLGLPGCTGAPSGLPWLRQFLANCSDIVSGGGDRRRNCTWDFLPVHWYDNFEGLASHIGERRAEWPDAEIWITEYAYANQDLSVSQAFYNETADWFDSQAYIGRYSYFGAFRADNSNVGPNAALLSKGGQLTDIGAWYLGSGAEGVDPQDGDSLASSIYPARVLMVALLALLVL